jgi:hypothetical protein
MASETDQQRKPRAGSRAVQVAAIAILIAINVVILHKGAGDISRIAEKHSGWEFWAETARYLIGNLAGGGAKKDEGSPGPAH